MPACTFLMSCYDRPHCLWASLGSLIQQERTDWECLCLCNHPEWTMRRKHMDVVQTINDSRIQYFNTSNPENPAWDCYWSAELGATKAEGDWIVMASDDSYYVPDFLTEMLAAADESTDFLYCDVLYDRKRTGNKRSILEQVPQACYIDKTAFMVRREKWIEIPGKNTDAAGPSIADGMLVDEFVRRGYNMVKVPLVLVCHN